MKKIALTNSDKFVIVDDTDYDYLLQWNWTLNNNGYAKRGTWKKDEKYTNIFVHREVIRRKINQEIPKGYVVDHIDRNPLNCRRNNLRLATVSCNNINVAKYDNKSSKFKGVSKYVCNDKRCQGWTKTYWRARINNPITGKQECKRFEFTDDGEIQAAKWYDARAEEIFGDFAVLNFK